VYSCIAHLILNVSRQQQYDVGSNSHKCLLVFIPFDRGVECLLVRSADSVDHAVEYSDANTVTCYRHIGTSRPTVRSRVEAVDARRVLVRRVRRVVSTTHDVDLAVHLNNTRLVLVNEKVHWDQKNTHQNINCLAIKSLDLNQSKTKFRLNNFNRLVNNNNKIHKKYYYDYNFHSVTDSRMFFNISVTTVDFKTSEIIIIIIINEWIRATVSRERYRSTVEYGLTSHQTHYRSYRGRFLRVRWPNQQCQALKDNRSTVYSIVNKVCVDAQWKV